MKFKPTFWQKVWILILSAILAVMLFDFIYNMSFNEFISFLPFVMVAVAVILFYIEDDEDDCDPFK